jgi:tRNA pseudouridine38-40 synthase
MKLALLIEYDGSDFAGWQSQAGVRTVQDELEASFKKILGRDITVHGAGRTDTGVHALGMVAHVDLEAVTEVDPMKLVAGLNATTGRDVVVHDIRTVPIDFHARHSAVSREYFYTIKQGRAAISRRVQWATHYQLDRRAMSRAANLLLGELDFTAFSKQSADVQHYRCIVDRSEWLQDGTCFMYHVRANRFVRGMVRALVGVMVEVGRGNTSLIELEKLLKGALPEARAKYLAPARGLILEHVGYPERFGLWGKEFTTGQSFFSAHSNILSHEESQ